MCNHCKVQSSPASLCISRFFTPSLSIRFLQNSLQQSILQNLSQLKSLPCWPLSSSFQSHRESHTNGTLEKYALDISSTFLLPDCHPSASGLPVLSSFVHCDTYNSGLTPCYTSDIFSMGSFWFTHTPHSGPCSGRSSFTSSPGTASGSLYSP